MSTKWCCHVVSTDTPISANQALTKQAPDSAELARVLRPEDHQQRDVQRRRLVEGPVEAGQHAEQPAECAVGIGPSKVKVSGKSRNIATATTCAVSSRRACVSSSRRSAQVNSDNPYKRSIDQYGTIVHGRNGIARSHSKTIAPTCGRCAVTQVAKP